MWALSFSPFRSKRQAPRLFYHVNSYTPPPMGVRRMLLRITSARLSGRQLEALVRGGQHADAVLCHHGGVFDAHAALPGEVHPRLDGDDHARLQHLIVFGELAEARILVNLQADAMPRAVREVLLVALSRDHVAGEGIRLLAGQPWSQPRLAGFLRPQHQIVESARLLARFAEADGARHIGAVASVARAHVERNRLAKLDGPVRGYGVW